MESLDEELDSAKAEAEKLQEQNRVKSELAENLKNSHIDLQSKIKEASARSEKLVQELNEKDDAISNLKRAYEEFKSSLEQKEVIVKNLTFANEKLRADFSEKLRKLEEENKVLALALDDANGKNDEQERKNSALKQEIEEIKRELAVSHKKCSESENKVMEEFGGREDAFFKLEEENKKLQDQLKWNMEQFGHLKDAHEKLLNDFSKQEMDSENKEESLDSDDESAKRINQEQHISELEEEIEGLKRLLTVSEKKRSEIENKVKAEHGGREDVFLKLEEGSKKFEDQLKWKKEQFDHLKDAHEKLRNEYRTKEKEWEKEKNKLLDGISSLQTNLESQVRKTKELQSRFEMCNQSLAHSESKRKLLEVEILELKTNFGNVCDEYEEAKSKFETVNAERDQEIAKMRSSLAMKDANYMEMEYQVRNLEQEKQDLLFSVKELQESRIQEAGIVSSSSKLQNKLKSLEQVHRGCLANLQAKESQWRCEMEKLTEELNSCKSESEKKDVCLNELKMELQEAQIQEAGIVSSSSKLQSKLKSLEQVHKGCLADLQAKESEWHCEMEKLTEELNFCKLESESKDVYLNKLKMELQESRIQETGIVSSSSKIQNKLKSLEQVHRGCLANLQAKESEWHSEMEKLTEELNFCKLELETKDVCLNELKMELEACDCLIMTMEIMNQESSFMFLVLKSEFCEARLNFAGNRAYVDLENEEMEEKNSGLVEELEIKKADFNTVQKELEEEREKVVVLTEAVQNLKELQLPLQKELEESKKLALNSETEVGKMKSDLYKVHEALDTTNEELYLKSRETNEIEFELQLWKSLAEKLEVTLEQNAQLRREMEASLISQTKVEMNLKQEKERLCHLVEEKDERIENLQQQLVELNEKETLHQLVEEKDQRISDLQHLVANLEREFESSISSFSSKLTKMEEERNFLRESFEKTKANEVLKEVEIQEKDLMIVELENGLRNLQKRVECLNSYKERVFEIQSELERKEMQVCRLESEIEEKKGLVEALHERIEKLCMEDEQLMENIAKVVKNVGDEYDDPVKENRNGFSFSPLMKKEERSPLKALNTIM